MITRCYNGNAESYQQYGGQGVRVCEFLRASPLNLILLIGDKPSSKHSIDRFPIKDGHYACGSCADCLRLGLKKNIRWATQKEQCRNKTNNILMTIDGETKCQTAWAEEIGISISGLRRRLKYGQDPFSPKVKPGGLRRKGEVLV